MAKHIDYSLANQLDRETLAHLDCPPHIKGVLSRLMTRIEALERATNPPASSEEESVAS